MAAPNIVNVATITGITTFIAGIATVGASAGVTTCCLNAASSGKVLKINALTAAAIGSTTGVTLNIDTAGSNCNWCSKYSIISNNDCGSFKFSLILISKENSFYLEEGRQIPGVVAQSNAGTLDVICSYEEIYSRRITMAHVNIDASANHSNSNNQW